jgi:hypothetical protein
MTVPVELAHHLANISSGLPFLRASFYFVLNNQSYLNLSVKYLNFQSWCFVKGAQASDIRLQGFYTNQTCMGR